MSNRKMPQKHNSQPFPQILTPNTPKTQTINTQLSPQPSQKIRAKPISRKQKPKCQYRSRISIRTTSEEKRNDVFFGIY